MESEKRDIEASLAIIANVTTQLETLMDDLRAEIETEVNLLPANMLDGRDYRAAAPQAREKQARAYAELIQLRREGRQLNAKLDALGQSGD